MRARTPAFSLVLALLVGAAAASCPTGYDDILRKQGAGAKSDGATNEGANSATVCGDVTCGPELAIDGDTFTYWRSASWTSISDSAFLDIDLGANVQVGTLRVLFVEKYAPQTFKFELSETPYRSEGRVAKEVQANAVYLGTQPPENWTPYRPIGTYNFAGATSRLDANERKDAVGFDIRGVDIPQTGRYLTMIFENPPMFFPDSAANIGISEVKDEYYSTETMAMGAAALGLLVLIIALIVTALLWYARKSRREMEEMRGLLNEDIQTHQNAMEKANLWKAKSIKKMETGGETRRESMSGLMRALSTKSADEEASAGAGGGSGAPQKDKSKWGDAVV